MLSVYGRLTHKLLEHETMARPHEDSILGDQELVRAIGEINVLWDEIEMYLWYKFDSLMWTGKRRACQNLIGVTTIRLI